MSEIDALSDDGREALWEQTRQHFLQRGDPGLLVGDLAGAGGWFTSRWNDRVDDFVGRSWGELHKLTGFGPGKINRLLSILAVAASTPPPLAGQVSGGSAPSSATPWPEILQRLGVPEAYPLALVPLPTRLREYGKESGAINLGDLLRLYEHQGGEAALLKVRNLGRNTTAVARRLYDAVRRGDETVLGEFLPLRPGGGLHLAGAMSLLLRGAEEAQRTVLRARLLEGRTLGWIGHQLGVSHERVRQLERGLLQAATAVLDWFADERDACYARIDALESFAEMFTPLTDDDSRLVRAMIRRVFDESSAGEAHAEARETLRLSWLGELHASPEFYLGRIVLRDWVAGRGGGETMLASFLAQGVLDGEFTCDEGTGCLRAARRPIKQVAAAFLRGWSDVEAEEWLSYLNRVGFFHEITLESLRRNHQSWRDDPDFPATEVRYPSPAGRGRVLLPDRQSTARPAVRLTAFTRQRVAPPELPELDACNRVVIGALAAADGVGIIGLLPLAEPEQRRIAAAVRRAHGGGVSMLVRLLECYPAALCYAAALAAGEGMIAREFWPPVTGALGLDLPPSRHPQISETFRTASITLGLLPPDARPGNLIWPFIFQAGVVPQFVQPLAQAIKRHLAEQALPDFEDAEERRAFADAILQRINAGYVRLRDMLASPAGPCVCAAILRAHRENDFGQLPPHLEAPMRDAFGGTDRTLHFAAPRLEFQRAEREVVLHLPRLPRRLVLPTSCWSVGEGKTFAADEPANVPVASLGGPSVRVGLRLRPPYQPWSRELVLRPAPGGPPQIFRLPGGRQVDLRPEGDGMIRLSAGEYAVVVPGSVASNVQEGWTALETGCRWIEYASFPNQIPLEITAGTQTWKIVPRVEAAVTVLADRGGGRLATTEGEWIYYGDDLFVSLSVPPEQAAEGEACEFVCADAAGKVDRRLAFDGGAFARGDSAEVDAAWVRETLAALPAGIHVLRLELLSPRCSVRRQVVFWKGLRYPQAGWGFACAVPLDNLAPSGSAGVRVEAGGLAVGTGPGAAEVRLTLVQPPMVLILPRPGVTSKLVDAVTGEVRPLDHRAILGCSADDPTRLVVECNDRGRWTLLANETPVREFPDGTGQHASRIAGFFHEFGDVVALRMRSPGGTVEPLLTLTRLAMAEGFRFELRPGENFYQGGFRLPAVYTELGVSLQPVLTGDDAPAPVVAVGLVPGHHRLEWAETGVIDCEVGSALTGEHILLLRVERTALARGVYLTQFFCRKAGEETWTPLRVPDAGGPVEARLCLVSHPYAPLPGASGLDTLLAGAWTGAMEPEGAAGWTDAANPAGEAVLAASFRQVTAVLGHPYPVSGWHSVKWMGRALTALCRQGVREHPGTLAALAAGELSARARQGETLYRPLAFGLPELWTLDGFVLRADGVPGDWIGRCFAAWVALGNGRGLNEFFATPAGHDVDSFVLPYLLGGGDRHERFLRDLARAVFELDPSGEPDAGLRLLGVEHFCRALGRLDRVTRVVTQVRRHVGTDESVNRRAMVSHLLHLDRRLPRLAAFVKNRLRMSNTAELDIDLYAESPAPEVRRLLLALTALARLQAAGRVNPAEAREQIHALFEAPPNDPTPIHKGLSLLVGLGGDFFACSLLFWELTLRAKP